MPAAPNFAKSDFYLDKPRDPAYDVIEQMFVFQDAPTVRPEGGRGAANEKRLPRRAEEPVAGLIFCAEDGREDSVEEADDALEEAGVHLTAPVTHIRVGL